MIPVLFTLGIPLAIVLLALLCGWVQGDFPLAQGIEAGTAETAKQGSVHESPVLEEDAPNSQDHPSQGGLHDR